MPNKRAIDDRINVNISLQNPAFSCRMQGIFNYIRKNGDFYAKIGEEKNREKFFEKISKK